jgi:hypothetical protein
MKKTYTQSNAIELTKDLWKNMSKEKKEELLNAIDSDLSWAEVKTIDEMNKRGGKLVVDKIIAVNREYIKRSGGKVTIDW